MLVEKYPEMIWLTGSVEATPEVSIGDHTNTIGKQLFPVLDKKQLIELERTVVGILTLRWVMAGDYDSFTACQGGSNKLTSESFQRLKEYTESILKTPEDFDALETFTVINDLGKIRGIVEQIAERSGVQDVDHDKILLVGLERHPDLSPSFYRLSSRHQKVIIDGLKTKFNISQFIQGENVPASLEGLKNVDTESLKFYLLHALYDIAGAAGQSVQNGSAVMNEPTYENFRFASEALEEIGKGQSCEQAYNSYLAKQGKKFDLNIAVPQERVVARICCMLRLVNPEQAQRVLAVMQELPRNTQAILVRELNINGINDGLATLIYYAPAFLLNLHKKFSESGDFDAFTRALTLGLTTLARVFQEARIANKGRIGSGVYTVMASELAKIAGENPDCLYTQDIRLKTVGSDAEIEFSEAPCVNKEKFGRIAHLSDIPGQRIAVIGIGGGSDCIQAALLAKLLEKFGKTCQCVISIRTDKTTSQSSTGKVGEQRTVENHGGEITKNVFRITPETTGSGRFLENLPAGELPVYLVVEQEGESVTRSIKSVLEAVGGVDTVIAVDTGGDALYSTTGYDAAKAKPDQDLRSLKAISELSCVHKLSCEIAVGVDTPPNGERVLLDAEALYYEPTPEDEALILRQYQQWQMDGSSEDRYGKTSLAWQEALAGHFGYQSINLPTRVVLDTKNPWDPFINIQPSMRGMFFSFVTKHLVAISR